MLSCSLRALAGARLSRRRRPEVMPAISRAARSLSSAGCTAIFLSTVMAASGERVVFSASRT